MAAARLARPELQRGEGHQSLVAECGRTERLHTHSEATTNQRVVMTDARRMQTERAGLQLAFLHVLFQKFEKVLVLIILVGAHVDDKVQLVGNNVVLRATLHDRHRHLRRP